MVNPFALIGLFELRLGQLLPPDIALSLLPFAANAT